MSTTNVQFAVAVHIAAALGFKKGSEVKSAVLAQSVKADPSFVRRSLSKLVKAGLVTTTRGKHGACFLSRSASEITLLELYQASGAPPAFALHTYPVEERCPISAHIKESMEVLLEDAQSQFEQSLAKISLADVITRIEQKCQA